MAAKKVQRRKARRSALVHTHLENVSRELLEEHPEIVRNFLGQSAGIYALYKGDALYYVGLAKTLRSRLRAHGKDRHGGAWDRFSIYLTVDNSFLREIEALVLRISSPVGTKQKGKLASSRDMRRNIQKRIRQKHAMRESSLFEFGTTRRKRQVEESKLQKLFPAGAQLLGENKQEKYWARIRKDGRIRFNKKFYRSLSLAGTEAVGRSMNGWWFWKVKRGGKWVRLTEIRRAGTPLFSH